MSVDIETLLRWTFRDQLPKEQGGGGIALPMGFARPWKPIDNYGELLTLVDEPSNRWGVVPDPTAGGAPHPDAILVAEAVRGLDACEIDLPEGWNPIADLGDLGRLGAAALARGLAMATSLDRDGRRRLKETPAHLIFRHAILGGCPDWRARPPVVAARRAANGRDLWFMRRVIPLAGQNDEPIAYEVEVDGWCAKKHRPHDLAYRKYVLDPDPTEAIAARIEYEIWRAALVGLVETLAPRLTTRAVVMSARPPRPWEETAPAPGPRIHPDLTPQPVVPAAGIAPRRWRRSKAETLPLARA
jgi:hypothetical protein